jgi:hypothetical protein
MAGPLIVTAAMAAADSAWLDTLRRAHYPAELNRVPAHLTVFHALPPSSEEEVRRRLCRATIQPPPQAWIEGLMDLGGGVAFRVVSPELDRLREELAEELHGLLGAQDSGGWRPHVTIQNKVAPNVARALKAGIERGFVRRPLALRGLGLHLYRGGPWETIGAFPFRGIR